MQISLGTRAYIGACIVAGALNARSNPALWISTFAVGIFAGTFWGNKAVQKAVQAQQQAHRQDPKARANPNLKMKNLKV